MKARWRAVPLTLAAIAGAVSELTAVALAATAAWLISRAAQQPPLASLAVAIVLVRALAIGKGAFRYIERLAGHDAVLRVMARLRGRFFDALTTRSRSELTDCLRSDLLTGVVADVDAVQTLLIRAALPTVSALLVSAAVCGWLLTLLPVAALGLAGGLLAAGLLMPLFAAVLCNRIDRRLVAVRAELASRTVDLIEGIEDLTLNGGVGVAFDRQRAARDTVSALGLRRARNLGLVAGGAMLLRLGTVGLVGVLATAAQASGRLDSVTVTVVVLAALSTMEITTPLVAAGEQTGTMLSALHRVRRVLRSRSGADPVAELGPGIRPPDPATAPVAVRLSEVSVHRPGERRPAIDSVSLTVPKGARVAVIGPTGAGKSTLLSVILGLVTPTVGVAELFAHDLRRLSDGARYPRLVSGLTQDAYLFGGSIRANLLLARPDVGEAHLWSVLARVGAADWVRGLGLGLDTVIGPDSCLLAGGQRQRLALATALLADPGVLVLDEPADSLDEETAALVFDDIVRATRGRTAVVASHRIGELRRFDMIVVLSRGRILQTGTHEQLIAEDGYYRARYVAETGQGEGGRNA